MLFAAASTWAADIASGVPQFSTNPDGPYKDLNDIVNAVHKSALKIFIIYNSNWIGPQFQHSAVRLFSFSILERLCFL